jgi:hypothetical protein
LLVGGVVCGPGLCEPAVGVAVAKETRVGVVVRAAATVLDVRASCADGGRAVGVIGAGCDVGVVVRGMTGVRVAARLVPAGAEVVLAAMLRSERGTAAAARGWPTSSRADPGSVLPMHRLSTAPPNAHTPRPARPR